MAEESLLQSRTEDLSNGCPNKFSSLLSEISNASTLPFVLAFTAASCGAFNNGCAVGYTAPTQSSIVKDLNLSIADASSTISVFFLLLLFLSVYSGSIGFVFDTINCFFFSLSFPQFSFFGSILTVGLILGALVCGKLTDLVGRVYTIWITNILFIIGWLAIAFAEDVWLLDVGRLLQGFAGGINSYLGPIYVSEIAPKNLRGAASSFVQLFIGVGISVFYALGTFVEWRSLAILGFIPSLVVLPLLFFVPESPRWLAKVGRGKEVEAVLLSLRGAKTDVSDETAHILEYTQHVEEQEGVDGHGFFKLFQRKYVLPLTIGAVLISVPQFGGLNGYSFYTDTIFTSTGVSSDVGFILTSIVQMSGGVLGVVLVDISGRRSLVLVSQAGMFFGCLATAISFFLQKNNFWETGTPTLSLISVMVYFGSYGLGMGPIPWIIASEIYPVDVKGAAGTVCNLVCSISSWLVSYSFNFLIQWSSTGTFLMFATAMCIGFVFTAKFVPETKGKSLEEIQSLFTDPPPEEIK